MTSVTGAPLPNPRTVSRLLLVDVDRPHPTINLLLMQFGQFITHDVTQSASVTTSMLQFIEIRMCSGIHFTLIFHFTNKYLDDGSAIRCCTKNGQHVLPNEALHFACLPILIDPDDEFYRAFDQGCINFVRSALATDGQCQLGYGKQVNIKIGFGSIHYADQIQCII